MSLVLITSSWHDWSVYYKTWISRHPTNFSPVGSNNWYIPLLFTYIFTWIIMIKLFIPLNYYRPKSSHTTLNYWFRSVHEPYIDTLVKWHSLGLMTVYDSRDIVLQSICDHHQFLDLCFPIRSTGSSPSCFFGLRL